MIFPFTWLFACCLTLTTSYIRHFAPLPSRFLSLTQHLLVPKQSRPLAPSNTTLGIPFVWPPLNPANMHCVLYVMCWVTHWLLGLESWCSVLWCSHWWHWWCNKLTYTKEVTWSVSWGAFSLLLWWHNGGLVWCGPWWVTCWWFGETPACTLTALIVALCRLPQIREAL